jgi:hypothetical protein
MKLGRIVLLGCVSAIALLMSGNAMLWLLVPARAAEALQMPLLTGPALSSQMDIGAFFLGAGTFVITALVTRERPWFLAAAVLLLGAALYRTVAFALHGAPFLADMVVLELVMGVILIVASRVIGRGAQSAG